MCHSVWCFFLCVFIWLHLGLTGKCDAHFEHSHKKYRRYCILKGETRGYNGKHMWIVMVQSIWSYCIAIGFGTTSVYKHTRALIYAMQAICSSGA